MKDEDEDDGLSSSHKRVVELMASQLNGAASLAIIMGASVKDFAALARTAFDFMQKWHDGVRSEDK